MNTYKFLNEKGQHMHELGGNPLYGTSTVLQVISKNLTWWAAELAAVECLEKGEQIPTIRAEYEEACKQADKKSAIDALQKKYPIFKSARFAHFATKNKKAEQGTDLHFTLETYVKMCIAKDEVVMPEAEEFLPVKQFAIWARENVQKFLISEGHCYSQELWCGGITDCMALMKNGKVAIIDFKSAKEAYDSMFLQVAGYDLQQAENGIFDADGNKILEPQNVEEYYVIPFGSPEFKVDKRTATEELRDGFKAAVTLHKLLNK